MSTAMWAFDASLHLAPARPAPTLPSSVLCAVRLSMSLPPRSGALFARTPADRGNHGRAPRKHLAGTTAASAMACCPQWRLAGRLHGS